MLLNIDIFQGIKMGKSSTVTTLLMTGQDDHQGNNMSYLEEHLFVFYLNISWYWNKVVDRLIHQLTSISFSKAMLFR